MINLEQLVTSVRAQPVPARARLLPPEIDRLGLLDQGGLLAPEEATWLARAANRRALLDAVLRVGATIDANSAKVRELFARYMQSAPPTPGWSRIMGFAIDGIPDWLPLCEETAAKNYARYPGKWDVYARLARAVIDRALTDIGTGRADAWLTLAARWCECDVSAGRTRGLAAIQLARVALLRGRAAEAERRIEDAYRAHPEARDGFTHLAWIDRARGDLAATLSRLRCDVDAGRQSDPSRCQHAALLAEFGVWDEAMTVLAPVVARASSPIAAHTEFAVAVVAALLPAWRRHGQTGHLHELASRVVALLSSAPTAPPPPARACELLAMCHAVLGDDVAMEAALAAHDLVSPRSPVVRADLAISLIEAGDMRRGEQIFAGIVPFLLSSPRHVPARTEALWRLGRRAEAMAFIAEAEAKLPNLRGVRTRLAALVMAEVVDGWRSGAVDREALATCRDLLDAEVRSGRANAETTARQIRLALLAGDAAAALLLVRSWYAENPEAANGHVQLAGLLLDARRIDEAGDYFDRDVQAGRLRGVPATMQYAGYLARGGRCDEADRLVATLYAENSELRGLYAQLAAAAVAEPVSAWSRGETVARDDPRLAAAGRWCAADAAGFRADGAAHVVAARLALLRGRIEEAFGHVRTWYANRPLEADGFSELGSMLRHRSGQAELVAMAERDLAVGRLSVDGTRLWLRLLAFSRTEDARAAALRHGARLRRHPDEARSCLHARDPYVGFDFRARPYDQQGWHSDSPIFAELVDAARPGLFIEVGTWKGGSAIAIAQAAKARGLAAPLVCVDTWLGAIEFWLNQADAGRFRALDLHHGFPSVYYQFLANCCHAGVADRITPFPQTSTTAALWFVLQGFAAELIYIDASHAYDDVRCDVAAYWDVLAPGGVMFGDDYALPDVARAVQEFAAARDLSVEARHNCWVLRKAGEAVGAR